MRCKEGAQHLLQRTEGDRPQTEGMEVAEDRQAEIPRAIMKQKASEEVMEPHCLTAIQIIQNAEKAKELPQEPGDQRRAPYMPAEVTMKLTGRSEEPEELEAVEKVATVYPRGRISTGGWG